MKTKYKQCTKFKNNSSSVQDFFNHGNRDNIDSLLHPTSIIMIEDKYVHNLHFDVTDNDNMNQLVATIDGESIEEATMRLFSTNQYFPSQNHLKCLLTNVFHPRRRV